jgi:hypothetical protein
VVEWRQKAKPVGRAHVIGVALVAVLLFAGYQVQKHREGPPSPRRHADIVVFSPTSPETRLATLQLGLRPDHANSTVKRFSGLLDIFIADCPANTRRGLADLTIRSVTALRRDGIQATPTEVLGGVLGFVDMGATAECSAFFERYVTRRRRDGARAVS